MYKVEEKFKFPISQFLEVIPVTNLMCILSVFTS